LHGLKGANLLIRFAYEYGLTGAEWVSLGDFYVNRKILRVIPSREKRNI